MVNYIFVIGPIHNRDALTALLQLHQLTATRWMAGDIAVVHASDDGAYRLRLALRQEGWEFLLSSTRYTSRGVGSTVIYDALAAQWALEDPKTGWSLVVNK